MISKKHWKTFRRKLGNLSKCPERIPPTGSEGKALLDFLLPLQKKTCFQRGPQDIFWEPATPEENIIPKEIPKRLPFTSSREQFSPFRELESFPGHFEDPPCKGFLRIPDGRFVRGEGVLRARSVTFA